MTKTRRARRTAAVAATPLAEKMTSRQPWPPLSVRPPTLLRVSYWPVSDFRNELRNNSLSSDVLKTSFVYQIVYNEVCISHQFGVKTKNVEAIQSSLAPIQSISNPTQIPNSIHMSNQSSQENEFQRKSTPFSTALIAITKLI